MWTHKPTRIGGQTRRNDRIVLMAGREVGRVYAQDHPATGEEFWRWFVQIVPAAQGTAETMAEALEAVRRGVESRT